MADKMIFKTFPVGPLQCNCCIIGDPVSKRAIVVDPGGDAQKILAELAADELTLVSIIHTHAHLDHILAAGELKAATGAPIHLHKDDKMLWDMVEQQCQAFGIPVPSEPLPGPDFWLQDDEALACCGVFSTPRLNQTGLLKAIFWFTRRCVSSSA